MNFILYLEFMIFDVLFVFKAYLQIFTTISFSLSCALCAISLNLCVSGSLGNLLLPRIFSNLSENILSCLVEKSVVNIFFFWNLTSYTCQINLYLGWWIRSSLFKLLDHLICQWSSPGIIFCWIVECDCFDMILSAWKNQVIFNADWRTDFASCDWSL